MRKFLIAGLVTLAAAVPALAEERCNVPQDQWRPEADLRADLEGKGWTISNIKTEDGCFEVYGKDQDGKKVEVFIDPASFEIVGSDE
ncbi:PepSY domain-containing protein [Gemmobacter caeruleus]|uniref:PepSY domain-containing protein n=1 Tax=Gemmobacter caeruleus TaxID=2595004 RepID=UPI0011F04447|nr:PepSY domain-containing protein [Gemmobacter caeruleus]